MSSKLAAITHYVDNYEALLQGNLLLPIESDIDGFVSLKNYMPDWGYSFLPPYETLFSLPAIPYFHYFYKDSDLRIQYFDTIRAMGLKEMWVMEELILDHCKDEDMTIDDFLASVKASLNFVPHEFSEYMFETYDKGHGRIFPQNYYSLYHDDFKDCFEKVMNVESDYNVIVLGLNENPENHIRVLKDDKVMLLNMKNKRFVEL